jgi:hypothetical protein
MLLGHIYLKQTHLILRDVDGSEVSLTLDDVLEVLTFLTEHKQEIEQRAVANWQQFITEVAVARTDQEQ